MYKIENIFLNLNIYQTTKSTSRSEKRKNVLNFFRGKKISRTSWSKNLSLKYDVKFRFKKMIWENQTFHSREFNGTLHLHSYVIRIKYSCRQDNPGAVVKIFCLCDKQSARVARWWRKARVHRLANFATRTEMRTTTADNEYYFVFFSKSFLFLFVAIMTKKNRQWRRKIDQSLPHCGRVTDRFFSTYASWTDREIFYPPPFTSLPPSSVYLCRRKFFTGIITVSIPGFSRPGQISFRI